MVDVYDEINLKLVMLGDGGVGKTSLVNSMTGKEIPDRYMPTIGSTINKKEYTLENSNFLISVNLWDIGGQRSFNPLNPVFFSNVDIAFLIYDVSKPSESITDLSQIYLSNLLKNTGECLVFVIGNKIDLDFDEEKIKEILKREKLDRFPNIFVSALTYDNVESSLEFAVYSYFNEMAEELEENSINVGAEEFLNFIDKQKSDLEEVLINIDDLTSVKVQKKAPVKVSKKKLDKEEIELEKYSLIQERLDDLDTIKEQIRLSFRKNINIIEDLIYNLKKTPIDSLRKNINKTLTQLDYLKGDFELKLNTLLDIDRLSKIKDYPVSIKSIKNSESDS